MQAGFDGEGNGDGWCVTYGAAGGGGEEEGEGGGAGGSGGDGGAGEGDMCGESVTFL